MVFRSGLWEGSECTPCISVLFVVVQNAGITSKCTINDLFRTSQTFCSKSRKIWKHEKMISVPLPSFVIVSRPKSESHFYCTLSYPRPHPRTLLTDVDVRLKAEPEVKEHCGLCCSRVVALLLPITMCGRPNSSLGWFVLNQVAIVARIFSTAVLRMLWPHRTFEIVFVDFFGSVSNLSSQPIGGHFSEVPAFYVDCSLFIGLMCVETCCKVARSFFADVLLIALQILFVVNFWFGVHLTLSVCVATHR